MGKLVVVTKYLNALGKKGKLGLGDEDLNLSCDIG